MDAVRRHVQALLDHGPILLSGGFGTELHRRGVPTPLPLWSSGAVATHPTWVQALHRDYVLAGAQIVTANTFRADRVSLAQLGRSNETRSLNKVAVRLARDGVADAFAARPDVASRSMPILVAGSVAPIADCYEPTQAPDEQTLIIEHGIRMGHLLAAGADLAMVETMNNIPEARIALEAAAHGQLPAMIAFTCAPGARLLSGAPLVEAVHAVEPLGPLAILVNCCAPPVATEALEALRGLTSLPVGVYANGRGEADPGHGWRFGGGNPDRRYVREARRWLQLGATIIGGCCGTTPRTIRRLARLVNRDAREPS